MANIPIWPGSGSFTSGSSTPFGFYDADTSFQDDAPKLADWCAQRLGYPLVDIELQAINFFSCFEEAVNEYGAQLYNFQIINNFQTFEGNTTSSNYNNQLITPNLGGVVNISEQYGSEVDGGGGNYKIETGSLAVTSSQQTYDLLSNVSSSISGSEAVYVKRIYHYAPSAINRYFDPYAGTGTGIQSLMQTFGFGNYSPGVNFMLMPIYFDTLKLQAIELNDTIRKSGYHFNIEDNRYLKLFPIPTTNYTLHFEYVLKSVANAPVKNTDKGLITDISNTPYTTPTYTYINQPGRQWIRRYALALAKEMLGYIRGKYSALPIPNAEITLNGADLISAAQTEKEGLITELKDTLDTMSRQAQLERKQAESDAMQQQMNKIPLKIYIG